MKKGVRYLYYADWDGGSMEAKSLDERKTIYNTAMNILQASTTKQNSLFGEGF